MATGPTYKVSLSICVGYVIFATSPVLRIMTKNENQSKTPMLSDHD